MDLGLYPWEGKFCCPQTLEGAPKSTPPNTYSGITLFSECRHLEEFPSFDQLGSKMLIVLTSVSTHLLASQCTLLLLVPAPISRDAGMPRLCFPSFVFLSITQLCSCLLQWGWGCSLLHNTRLFSCFISYEQNSHSLSQMWSVGWKGKRGILILMTGGSRE